MKRAEQNPGIDLVQLISELTRWSVCKNWPFNSHVTDGVAPCRRHQQNLMQACLQYSYRRIRRCHAKKNRREPHTNGS